jgi:hypothetical protein
MWAVHYNITTVLRTTFFSNLGWATRPTPLALLMTTQHLCKQQAITMMSSEAEVVTGCGGGGNADTSAAMVEHVVTVEYLESSMLRGLLWVHPALRPMQPSVNSAGHGSLG